VQLRERLKVLAGERRRFGYRRLHVLLRRGGVLSQRRTGSPLRFRCQVGHAYTAEVLVNEKEDSVDEAVRTALRIIEERRVLLGKMAADEAQVGRATMAEHYRKRANELREHETTLRRAALAAAIPKRSAPRA